MKKLFKVYGKDDRGLIPLWGAVRGPEDIHQYGQMYYYKQPQGHKVSQGKEQVVFDDNDNELLSYVPRNRGWSGIGYNKGDTFDIIREGDNDVELAYVKDGTYDQNKLIKHLLRYYGRDKRDAGSKALVVAEAPEQSYLGFDAATQGYEAYRDFPEEVQVRLIRPDHEVDVDKYRKTFELPDDLRNAISRIYNRYNSDTNYDKILYNDLQSLLIDELGGSRGTELIRKMQIDPHKSRAFSHDQPFSNATDNILALLHMPNDKKEVSYIDWYDLLNNEFPNDDTTLSDCRLKSIITKDCYYPNGLLQGLC